MGIPGKAVLVGALRLAQEVADRGRHLALMLVPDAAGAWHEGTMREARAVPQVEPFLIMVAQQENAWAALAQRFQRLDGARGVGAAIEIVPEENQPIRGLWAYGRHQAAEELCFAMQIADRQRELNGSHMATNPRPQP